MTRLLGSSCVLKEASHKVRGDFFRIFFWIFSTILPKKESGDLDTAAVQPHVGAAGIRKKKTNNKRNDVRCREGYIEEGFAVFTIKSKPTEGEKQFIPLFLGLSPDCTKKSAPEDYKQAPRARRLFGEDPILRLQNVHHGKRSISAATFYRY